MVQSESWNLLRTSRKGWALFAAVSATLAFVTLFTAQQPVQHTELDSYYPSPMAPQPAFRPVAGPQAYYKPPNPVAPDVAALQQQAPPPAQPAAQLPAQPVAAAPAQPVAAAPAQPVGALQPPPVQQALVQPYVNRPLLPPPSGFDFTFKGKVFAPRPVTPTGFPIVYLFANNESGNTYYFAMRDPQGVLHVYGKIPPNGRARQQAFAHETWTIVNGAHYQSSRVPPFMVTMANQWITIPAQ